MPDATELDLSIVIPVYNSAATLHDLVRRLIPVLAGQTSYYEIVFIDDGSRDDSWKVLNELAAQRPDCVTVIQLMRNYGQHNAIMCGLRHSRGRVVVTMDDDLQNPPEEIPKLLAALRENDLDLVYGWYGEKKHSPWRNLGSGLVNAFYRIVFHSTITITSFRGMRRELLRSIFPYNLNFTFLDGLLAWNTQRVGQVEVAHHPRSTGRSGYSLAKLVSLALNLFTNFSLLPLQFASGCGLAAAGVGFLLAFFFFVQYLLSNIGVPGYASIIVTLLILGGLQLLALGIMGEYMGRLHLNVNRKPQYVERQIVGPNRSECQQDAPQRKSA